MLVERRSVPRRRIDHAEGIESGAVITPLLDRVTASPVQFLTPVRVMTSPERPISLIETDDVFDTLERSPR